VASVRWKPDGFLLSQLFRGRQSGRVSITRRQFEQMQQRLGGATTRAAAPVLAADLRAPLSAHGVILGVDPSLRGTGYGVIRLAKPHPLTLCHGTISCPQNWERSRCLVKIVETLREVLKQNQPTVCVVEGFFTRRTCKPPSSWAKRAARRWRPSPKPAWKFLKSPRAK
jgi:hypothetical protein